MTNHPKVVSTFYFKQDSQEKLREAANGEVVCLSPKEDLLPALRDAEVFCGPELPNNWREAAPELRWIQCPFAGVNALRPGSLLQPDSGVIITTASGIHGTNISEYVFGSMLMFNRSWPEMVHFQSQHVWAHPGPQYGLRERELYGRTLGIIGLGNIGRRIAQVARAFGMKVIATRFSVRTEESDPDVDRIYPQEQLLEVLSRSDYVVIAVPLTDRTKNMIGERELRAMQPHAYLVNIARGAVIDEAALLRALREKWIAGAGLDVTVQEPLPADSPLFDAPNLILSPHISGATEFYDERLADLFADNLRRYRAGQPLRNIYDPQRGY